MATFFNDLRYGVRKLGQAPGFAVACVLTLALGIGANTAVFSAMSAILLRSLPVADPQSLVYLRTSNPPQRTGTVDWNTTFSYSVYDALRQEKQVFKDVIVYVPLGTGKVTVRYAAEPEEAEGDMVSGNFFSGLGVPMLAGRAFNASDEKQHASVGVLSYRYWQARFAHDPAVIGKTLYVQGVPITIIGVASEGFEGLEAGHSSDFWIPLQDRAELNAWGNPPDKGQTYLHNPTWWCLQMLGRLRADVSRSQAVAALQPVFRSAAYIGMGNPVRGEKPPLLKFEDAKSFPGFEEMYGKPLKVLMALVGLVLLIALSNVVMLLVARNTTRQREFALRLALGAGRAKLFRQLLAEGLLLVTLGGLLAWLFAVSATSALAVWAHIEASLAPDASVLLFALALVGVAALLFGLAPLRAALSANCALDLKASAVTSSADPRKVHSGKFAIAFQVALCLVLLVSASLLVRTLRNLQHMPLGLRTEGLVVFDLNPLGNRSAAETRNFYENLLQKLRILPGVEAATIMENRLGSGWSNNRYTRVDGKVPEVAGGGSILVRSNSVGADFFRTLCVPLHAGREFTPADNANAPHVAIVNELFVQRFLTNRDPLGHMISGNMGPTDEATIVGVVANHKYREIEEEPVPMAWYPYAQSPEIGPMTIELRVSGPPLGILASVRRVVQRMDPNLPLIQPLTQQAQFEESISRQLLFARLAGFFGILAMVLVATGIYGTLSYRVSMRTKEIGVRMAIGSPRGLVVWMILKDSLLLTGLGLMCGVPLAMAAARLLGSALYQVTPLDMFSYAAAILGVIVVALTASAMPARRAASIDPLRALGTE